MAIERRFDTRRLVAIDMWGLSGSRLRRRLILAEFLLGFLASVGLGAAVLTSEQTPGWTLLGFWLVGVGLNYLPLGVHAVNLVRNGALERELLGVDVRAEISYYSRSQFRLVVPLWVLLSATTSLLGSRDRGT